MSDSEDSRPANSRIEQALRNVVSDLYKREQLEDLTVKRVRRITEQDLELPEDFFKSHAQWKDKSKSVITQAVAEHEQMEDAGEDDVPPPAKPKSRKGGKSAATGNRAAKSKPSPARKPREPAPTKKGAKRAPPSAKQAPSKRRKVSPELSDNPAPQPGESDIEDGAKSTVRSPATRKGKQTPSKRPSIVVREGEADAAEDVQSPPKPKSASPAKPKSRTKPTPPEEEQKPGVVSSEFKPEAEMQAADSDSELSSVIDEPPSPKQQAKSSGEKPARALKRNESGFKPNAKEDDPSRSISNVRNKLSQNNTRKSAPKKAIKSNKPKRLRQEVEAEDSDSDLSSVIDEPPGKNRKSPSSKTLKSTELEELEPKPKARIADSDSDLSSLVDEPSKKKRSTKPASKKPARSVKSKPAKPKPSSSKKPQEQDPNDAEIRRLQGWLLKCGIRKLWHRELASYDTPKAKISHLKTMLKDVGMDGRYSLEKARQIKERRELAADLEAVTEGNRRWGQAASDEEKQKRRRPVLSFVDSDEESG